MSDTTKAGVEALTGTLLGLTAITVALRFYARHKAKLSYLADDWLMLLAFVAFIGSSVCAFLLLDLGTVGYSSSHLTPQQHVDTYVESTKLQVSFNAITMFSLACTKASALSFYRRIFCVQQPNMRIFSAVSIAMVVIVACWFVTFELLNGLQCHGHFDTSNPVSYAKYCTLSWQFLYGYTVSDFLLDVLVVVLPIPSVLKLHTNLGRKLAILGIFMLACVGVGASCARMVVYIDIFDLGVVKLDSLDPERFVTRFFFYYLLEAGVSLVAINIPSLWPLFRSVSLESIMKGARSVTSLVSGSSGRSARQDSTAAERSENVERFKLDHLPKRETHGTDGIGMSDMPKPVKLEITRSDSVQVSSQSRSLEEGFGQEHNWE